MTFSSSSMPSLFKWRTSLLPGHPRNIVPTMLTCNFWRLLFVVDRTPCWEGLSGIGNQDWPERRPVFYNLAMWPNRSPGMQYRVNFRHCCVSEDWLVQVVWNQQFCCLFSVKVAPRILSSVLAIPRARTPYVCHIPAYWRICTFLDNRYVNAANGQKQILIIQVFPGGVFKNWVKPMYAWAEGQNRSE